MVFSTLLYFLLCLPILAYRHFDPSIFVVAGDRYVQSAQLEAPLRVKAGSNGYDGQFYYRLALHPLSAAVTQSGITFDHPAFRMQRIFYPLLGWAASFGRAGAAAWALFGVNLFGLGAIAWLGVRLARRLALPDWCPVAIVVWPGFLITLLHDTAEITATALMLAALLAYLEERFLLYAALAAAAALTRETTILLFAGFFLQSVVMRAGAWRIVLCAVVVVPFLVWLSILAAIWHEASQAHGVSQNLGWPFVGALKMLAECVTGARPWANTVLKDAVMRGFVLMTALPLLVLCGFVAARTGAVLRQPALMGMAAGWILIVALMSLLSSTGSWVDPDGYLRAFTECYVIGCLVLAASGLRVSRRFVAGIGSLALALTWALGMAQMR